jgi:hypothetical protein
MRGSGERICRDAGEAKHDPRDRRNDEKAHDDLLVEFSLLLDY